jgi:TrmH family RNA methyltransferase
VRGHDDSDERTGSSRPHPIRWAGAVTRRSTITSSANDRLKAVRRLARRGDAGVFLAEGHRQLRRALEARAVVRDIFAAPELYLGSADAELVSLAERRGARVLELGEAAFRSISSGPRPDGLVAVVERWPTALSGLPVRRSPLLLVAQGIERPGNLGTIVRTACSSGATGFVACDARTEVFHPDAVRGSVGTLFHVAVAECATEDALPWLREHGIRLVVATPEARRPFWEADLAGPVALVVGSERHGVGEAWRDAADTTLAIPMPGPSDSLNVAVAAGIVLFEAVRQRRSGSARSEVTPAR